MLLVLFFINFIDHLPTLIPRESSVNFSNDLLPYLEVIDKFEGNFEDKYENFLNDPNSFEEKELTWLNAFKLYNSVKSKL